MHGEAQTCRRVGNARAAVNKAAYRQLWRLVDGAIADAFATHPEYLTRPGQKYARASLAKRITGAVLGYAEQSAQGRSGKGPAVNTAEPVVSVSASMRAPSTALSAGGSHGNEAHP